MASHHPGMSVEGNFLDPRSHVSVAAIGRAGTLPGFRCFERLSELLDPTGVCLDHILLQRQTDAAGRVIGVGYGGSKIGRPLDDRYLLVTDPMGATGSTMLYTLDLYTKEVGGQSRALVALHLIITPEYLRAVHRRYPQLEIYALRLDRGLSDPDVLQTVPGTHPDRERGLDDRHYIVPGMGGLGELVNNAYV
jgi:uracil phosphoribosyltransferase